MPAKFRLAMKDDGEMKYVNERGSLTTNIEEAKVYLSMSNAEEAKDKYHRKAKKSGDKRKVFLNPAGHY